MCFGDVYLENFVKTADIIFIFYRTERVLLRKDNVLKIFWEIIDMLYETIAKWTEQVSLEEKEKDLQMVLETVPLEDLLSAICEKYRGNVRHFAALKSWQRCYAPSKNSPVKTIALYYHKMGQGGVERVLSLLMPMFLKMGYKIVLITDEKLQETDYVVPEEVKHYTLHSFNEIRGNSEKTYKERALQLEQILQTEQVDILCYHAGVSPLVFYDLLICKSMGVKFVLCYHSLFSYSLQLETKTLQNEIELFPLVDKMVVLSNSERIFRKELGVKAVYIPNPYNDEILTKGASAEGTSIVWVGRLAQRQKRYLDVIPIMKRVVAKCPEAVLKIYGSEYFSSVEEFKQLIKENGLERNIIYCGYATDVNEIYRDAKILLVTSTMEAFPMNIYESKIKGIPLVTYEMPYLEMLKDGKGYVAVKQKDCVAAADALVDLLTDDALYQRLRGEAADSIKPFTNEVVCREWQKLFQSNFEEYNDCANEEYAIIFKELLHEASIGYEAVCETQKQLEAKLKKQQLVTRMLAETYKQKKKVAIYPYGAIGKEVHELLKDQDISVDLIVDNKLAKEDSMIKSVQDLEYMDCSEYLFFICSNKRNIFEELRASLNLVVDEKQIVDLFS